MVIMEVQNPKSKVQDGAAEALLTELVDFCQNHGQPCYEGWSRKQLEDYILFHMRQGTFAWARSGDRVVGCGIVWQDHLSHVRIRVDDNQHPLNGPSQPTGDCLFLGEWICRNRAVQRVLALHFEKRFPSWQSLKLVTTRHGRDGRWHLKHYRADRIARWKGEHARI